jgi:hypothetical protein
MYSVHNSRVENLVVYSPKKGSEEGPEDAAGIFLQK